MIKVLLSVYACEPSKGSEPEVGWKTAIGIAKYCRVKAITRSNNRELIDAELEKLDGPKPEFLYYDLPIAFLWLKRYVFGTSIYYALWQIAIRWRFRHEARKADLIHHVTFNGVQLPGFWLRTCKPVMLGPLGGGMTCPRALLKLYGKHALRELLRTIMIHALPYMPWWKLTIFNASKVIAANHATASLMQNLRNDTVPISLETAIDIKNESLSREYSSPDKKFRILWIGNLIPRKGPILAIYSVARALSKEPDIELWVAGSGPEKKRIVRCINKLGISASIKLLGRVQKQQVNALMDTCDALLFTSLRDTSGNVVLEAMARKLPTIVLWHHGMRVICDQNSAILIKPTNTENIIEQMAESIVDLRKNPLLAKSIADAAFENIKRNFSWDGHISFIFKSYNEILQIPAGVSSEQTHKASVIEAK